MPNMSTTSAVGSQLLDETTIPMVQNDLTRIENKLSDTPPFFGSDSILKKSLMTVPIGRPRGSRVLTKEVKDLADLSARQQKAEKQRAVEEEILGVDFSDLLVELRTELDVKRREEDRLHRDIAEIMGQSTSSGSSDLSRTFNISVSRLNNNLLLVESEAKKLANSLKVVYKLADNISSKVSALDVAKTRVVECLQLAGDMRDLGVCSEGVDNAISEEDYELAAQHIHRFLTLDQAVFQLRESVEKESGQSVRHSYEVLTAAASRLKDIFTQRLTDAVERKDIPTIQRFVRLFPMINEHAIGLEIFGKFVVSQLEKLGEENIKVMLAGGAEDNRRNVLFADTMFLFFEAVATVVEANQPVIENSYGSDRLLDFVQMLQNQIDKTLDVILKEFAKQRQFEQKAKAVEKLFRNPEKVQEFAEKTDALQLDVLLSEVTQMHTRAEMYWRFLKRRIADKKEQLDDDDDELDAESRKKKEEERVLRKENRARKLDTLLNRSLVGTKMQEIMGQYILMEQYYMQETVSKAIQMDMREDGQLTSSVVDDVLFIVRKCVRRALVSSSVDCTCAAINNGCTLLETTFHDHMATAIQVGYPSVGFAAEAFQTAQTAYNVIQHGKTVTEAGPEAQRDAFLTACNNARAAAEMIGELKKGLSFEINKVQRSVVDSAKLEHSLAQFDDVIAKTRQLADSAIQSLSVAAFRPKLKTSCEDYVDLNHQLSDDQLVEYEMCDPWVDHFTTQLDKHLATYQNLLLEQNYQNLLLTVCGEVCKQFERTIFKCLFNRLGGLQLDKEYRQLTGYLSGIAGWSAREKCARLAQLVALLNVDTVEEAAELCRHAHGPALLSEREVRKTLLLRSDLPEALINQLSI